MTYIWKHTDVKVVGQLEYPNDGKQCKRWPADFSINSLVEKQEHMPARLDTKSKTQWSNTVQSRACRPCDTWAIQVMTSVGQRIVRRTICRLCKPYKVLSLIDYLTQLFLIQKKLVHPKVNDKLSVISVFMPKRSLYVYNGLYMHT